MDLYTTSFSYPCFSGRSLRASTSPLSQTLPLPASGAQPPAPPQNVTIAPEPAHNAGATAPTTTAGQVEQDWEAVQRMCIDITTREGCLVTVTREQVGSDLNPSPPNTSLQPQQIENPEAAVPATTVWNFHLSGNYQAVMAARGAILREVPRDNRTTLKVPRTDILESPLATVSPLKPDVRRKLDEIAAESKAHIAVLNIEAPGSTGTGSGQVLATADGQSVEDVGHVNGQDASQPSTEAVATGNGNGDDTLNGANEHSPEGAGSAPSDDKPATNGATAPSASGAHAPAPTVQVTYGLETERLCELVITGSTESVEVAKVRLLVMLDELSGLASEACDIDYKLHNIIAGRKRSMIQQIEEETACNIYFPIPLVGVLNQPQPGSQQGVGYRNMGGLSVQPTGMTGIGMQMTGGMNMGGMAGGGGMNGMGMGMAPQMTGGMGMPMGGGGMNGGGFPAPHHQQHHNQQRNQPPSYNPHQHVQFPYQPQPLEFNPQTTRGLPYSGPAAHHFNPMNGAIGPAPGHGPGPGHAPGPGLGPGPGPSPGPMRVNHTGMSQMPTGAFQGNRGMSSPIPMNMSGMPGGQMPMGGMGGPHNGHHHPPGPRPIGHGPGPNGPGMGGMGMGNNLNMPFAGQNHMHVGLGGGPMGMNNGMQMGVGGGGGMGMNMTGVNLGQYGQGPHPGLSIHSGEQGVLGKANQICITGEFFGVQRARDMLLNVAMQKSRLVISRDTAILPRKLDWLLTERLEDIKAIMNDNGTYIQVPSVGSQASLITVFGDHRVNIERTIRSVMALACQFYVASFWLLPVTFDVLMPQASLNPAQMQTVLKHVSHLTGAEVVFKSNCFEMHGSESQVRAAVMRVLELEVVQGFHHEIRFQIELANEHRDFISGKKNGKINKIMKVAGVKIKFETFNDYNFLMDVSGSNIGALTGLGMLQEELPAEVSFHVPESYHKRIIGVGGKNIQRIMKVYGVYVKFSNAEEFAQLGGYLDNEDNVVARTPAKNAMSLDSLKASIMELVAPKDKDYTTEGVSIPRRYHRTLLGEKSIFIHDIESKTNSIVRFPYKETASDIVIIFGPESQVPIAAAMLLDHVPFEADLHVPPNPELTRLVASTEFILFAERVKRDHQIAIVPSAKFGQGDEAVFKFRCQRSNIDFLGTARDSLEEFLKQHNIQVFPSNAQKQAELFSDAFSYFNSKLLSTRNKAPATEAEGGSLVGGQPRPASTADVKALFEGQAGGMMPEDPAVLGFANPLSYDPRRVSEIWQPSSSTPQPAAPAASQADPSKRDSDPIIQDKVRAAAAGLGHAPGHPRGMSTRTQSLDITSLNFSRALAGSGAGQGPFAPMPPSPGGAGSSPNTASGPYFPGGGASGHAHHQHSQSTGKGYSYDTALDSVTQGMSNVQVAHP